MPSVCSNVLAASVTGFDCCWRSAWLPAEGVVKQTLKDLHHDWQSLSHYGFELISRRKVERKPSALSSSAYQNAARVAKWVLWICRHRWELCKKLRHFNYFRQIGWGLIRSVREYGKSQGLFIDSFYFDVLGPMSEYKNAAWTDNMPAILVNASLTLALSTNGPSLAVARSWCPRPEWRVLFTAGRLLRGRQNSNQSRYV